ncbi:MAG: hypothetical protein AAB281_01245 [Actinomycetota bacterium]
MIMRYKAAAIVIALVLASSLACSSAEEQPESAAPVAEAAVETAAAAPEGATSPAPGTGVLLFTIGMHIEPLGATVSSLAGGGGAVGQGAGAAQGANAGQGTSAAAGQGANAAQGAAAQSNKPANYNNQQFFQRHVQDILTLTGMVERHGGSMTIQAQTPFTSVAASSGNTILADLAARGHEIGLHFHEDAHLGKNTDSLPPETWCAVMKEEIALLQQASGLGSGDIRYWSGGNLYPNLLAAASCAGLDVNSDWKNPKEQSTVAELIGNHPWRPAGSSNGNDVSQFARHDANGLVVFLPEGQYGRGDFASMRRSQSAGGDEAYFEFLKQSLMDSLAAVDPDKVNVFHFTVHPGEFKGSVQDPFAVIERFLTEVVDPLVASGQVEWATLSEMADTFAGWERTHPGEDPKA